MCPFMNLPEARTGRWGQGLTAAKIKNCRWLNPVLVGQSEFREWTPDNLRNSSMGCDEPGIGKRLVMPGLITRAARPWLRRG
jgi:hypothetical protein